MPDSRNWPNEDEPCVFCADVPTDEYGLGVVGDVAVDGWVCRSCPLPTYGDGRPDPDPAVFALTRTDDGAGGWYLLLSRRQK